jgi:hypothetical protein
VRVVEEEMAEIPGQEAFLDVLTNMVGMIILLVVVMGLRASRAPVAPPHGTVDSVAEQALDESDVEAAMRQALSARNEVGDMMNRAVHIREETMARDQERAGLITYVTAVQQEIEARRAKLTVEEQRDFDVRQKLVAAQIKLDELTQEQVGMMSKAAEVEVIENKPTPIARKSTGRAVYLQLRSNHIAVIPFASVESELADDFRSNIWRARETDRFSRTIGPYDGFRLRYFVERRTATVRVNDDEEFDRRGDVTSLARFEFIPVATPLGEPVDDALTADSVLSQRLKLFPPDAGIIAVMVFPDSLEELHRVKRWLYDAGYSVAESPVPPGRWVSFSTRGGYQLFAQ